MSLGNAARVAYAATALAIVLLPWFRLDDYVPNGWEATWWARLALLACILGLALASMEAAGRRPLQPRLAARVRVTLAAVAVAAIALRLAVPPDFGFAFSGLEVPTERRIGAPVALATALLALVLELLRARPARPDPSPDSQRSGTAAEASAAGPSGPAPA